MTLSDDRTRTATLRDHLSCPVALPGEPGYERCAPWNGAAVTPAAVVLAASAHDVARTVRFAGAHGMRIAVQATGHGATGVDSDTVLLLTAGLDSLDVDVMRRTARVGAGVCWQQVLDALTPFGLAAPCGSAPGVGVVGLLTGGGVGPLARSIGLSSDHVRGFEVVTGTGDILPATPSQHADLFWGLRGGKGTLGIVTAVEIDLLPIPEFFGGAVYFDGEDAAAVLHAWRDWCTELPHSVTTSIAVLQLPPLPEVPAPLAGRMTVAVRFAAVGDHDEARRLLEPMRKVAEPVLDTVSVLPYAAIGAVHADPVDPLPVHEDHTVLREVTADTVDALLAVAGPGSGSPQTIVEIRQLGGAFARPPRHPDAFCHRDAAFTLVTIGVVDPAVPGRTARVIAALAKWSTGDSLPNFAPATGPDRLVRCYDMPTLFRLADLAEHYDPAGVLATGQVARIRD
ncbi:FAD-binding oxidoreductase [Mycolicibacterium flavescens]|uniref:FAD-linked oxidase n=1 Tax=Mycolicibacterium flavescens TaxID=1776 RepID=A0A1E3R8R7_MYCFV|nr:FAD-binding oxidoreductase [Mycolicibacterium flavescens]MCV7280029.1 FAD-binding oxidoreductase [Mycolicibacterium flavescens]ODQ86141.1 FAD-linked oxidase [Mycolicibacterium flavescens]